MPPEPLTFRLVPYVQVSSQRAVGFLAGHSELDAWETYDTFDTQQKRAVNVRMEHWIAGNNRPGTMFHGFPNRSGYEECFVFKYQEHRFYGFLCNPLPESNGRFPLCALTTYDWKSEWETDESILPEVEQWRTNSVGFVYPEYRWGGAAWNN